MLSVVREQDQAIRILERARDGFYTSPLLLVGPQGTGRRTSILALTRALFCSGSKTPDCTCVSCHQLKQGIHSDFHEIRATEDKDIGVDAVRSLIEESNSAPTLASVRVFLIDGADRMTMPASNALLKTLEEPPTWARFFLLAESQDRVLPTIKSRCGLVAFRGLPERYVLSKIQQFEHDATKALVFTRMGEGSLGRSIQLWGSGRLALRDKSFSIMRASVLKDVGGLFSQLDEIEKELTSFLRFMDHLLYDLLMIHVAPDKLINLDRKEELLELRRHQQVSDTSCHELRRRLSATKTTYQHTRINLLFHVKTILLEAFG